MKVNQNLVDKSKYNIKCPYEMTPEFIVVHNTANDASAANDNVIDNFEQIFKHYSPDTNCRIL